MGPSAPSGRSHHASGPHPRPPLERTPNDFRRSGLTHAEFCQRRGISIHSFRKRLYQAPTPKPTPVNPLASDGTAPHFVPITITPDPIPAAAASRQPLELL